MKYRESLGELSEALDLEFWLDRESISYRLSPGHSGMQANIETCPECGDRRHRVYLNVESGVGNCFVCNATFSKLSFIKSYLATDSWREVVEHVKEALKDQGWRPKRMTSAAVEPGEVRLPLSVELPTKDGLNVVYLMRRGVSDDLTRYFHLRYCEEDWYQATRADGTPASQLFKQRIIIPIYDLDGKLVTFQGRDVTGQADRKYLFPMGLPGTGRFLFNGQNVMGTRRVVMGEGVFDVIALKQAMDEEPELRDVVPIGSFGKHLSAGTEDGNDQMTRFLALKKAGLREVTIMWDGEKKALRAALEAAAKLVRAGLDAKVALLPAGKDPAEVTPDAVRKAFYGAMPYTKALEVKWSLRGPYA